MSYIETNPLFKKYLRDIGFIMAADTIIENLPSTFKLFADAIHAEWPPAGKGTESPYDDRFPGSVIVDNTKIICVRIRAEMKAALKDYLESVGNITLSTDELFTPEDVDKILVMFGLPWKCAYFASSYPVVDMGEEPPVIEVLRPMNFDALLTYLEVRKDSEGNVIPYTVNDKLTLFAGAENTIGSMCGLTLSI